MKSDYRLVREGCFCYDFSVTSVPASRSFFKWLILQKVVQRSLNQWESGASPASVCGQKELYPSDLLDFEHLSRYIKGPDADSAWVLRKY
jgi:hypothetical protein